ncbi:DUF7344 domain-containing protein [Halomicrobium urmianum]|uniref:DUF7344 domain-containing protein n=1 Tax=Halomicrobium urmianum TaxID=1586233 RepID=UPI001CD9EFF9|nr:hypothetical protein [Halomicrobium urmianum]
MLAGVALPLEEPGRCGHRCRARGRGRRLGDGDQVQRRVPELVVGERVEHRHRQQVATALVHVHLPHLAGADLVDYDRQARTVRLTEAAERLESMVAPLLA